jgi:hypothetical protein
MAKSRSDKGKNSPFDLYPPTFYLSSILPVTMIPHYTLDSRFAAIFSCDQFGLKKIIILILLILIIFIVYKSKTYSEKFNTSTKSPYSAASLEDQNSYLLEAELLEKASSQDQNSNSSYSAAQEVMSSVNSASPIGAVKNDIDYSAASLEDQNSYLLEAELLEKASSQDQNSNSSYSAAQR